MRYLMPTRMMCEPNLDLPQKIDLDSIRKSDKPYFAAHETDLKTTRPLRHSLEELKDFRVLPMFTHKIDHLNSVLSIKQNEYMLCRWNQFLHNIPESYVRISLYSDYRLVPQEKRKMQLTGRFYGVDNKLAPIPVGPDPRKIEIPRKCMKMSPAHPK